MCWVREEGAWTYWAKEAGASKYRPRVISNLGHRMGYERAIAIDEV
jgi:hypothetical protein